MERLDRVARALWERTSLVMKLGEAEEYATQLQSWHHFIERWMQRKKIASLRSDIGKFYEQIGADGAQRLADYVIDQLWRMAAQKIIPDKNPYGSAASVCFEQILDQAWEWRDERDFDSIPNSPNHWVPQIPEVDGLVTKEFMRSSAQKRIDERTLIATTPDLLHECIIFDGCEAMTIQHRASGLRALFILHGDGFGEVSATPSNVFSIDPEYPRECQEWRDLLGLGIGRQIYAEGHSLLPGVRWISKAGTPYAKRLRKKLHAADPYTWEDECRWCADEVVKLGLGSWKAADRNLFINHP